MMCDTTSRNIRRQCPWASEKLCQDVCSRLKQFSEQIEALKNEFGFSSLQDILHKWNDRFKGRKQVQSSLISRCISNTKEVKISCFFCLEVMVWKIVWASRRRANSFALRYKPVFSPQFVFFFVCVWLPPPPSLSLSLTFFIFRPLSLEKIEAGA